MRGYPSGLCEGARGHAIECAAIALRYRCRPCPEVTVTPSMKNVTVSQFMYQNQQGKAGALRMIFLSEYQIRSMNFINYENFFINFI